MMTSTALTATRPLSSPRDERRAASRAPSILLAVAACTLALPTSLARAEEPAAASVAVSENGEAAKAAGGDAPTSEPAVVVRGRRFFVGAVGGFALVSAAHPQLGTRHLMGPMLGLQAGYTLSPRWTLSLDFSSFEAPLERKGESEPFTTTASWLQPMAGCENCPPKVRGGYSIATTMHLSTLSPRIEVTPFGADGLYIGASAGVAFVGGLDARAGGAGTARAGFRLRPVKALTVAIEAGAQGQLYTDASAALYFAAAQGRLHF